jgi:glycosyltransferase involved in cell wall biosynthesis
MGGEAQLLDLEDVADAILRYYDDPALRERHGAQARQDMLKLRWRDIAAELHDLVLSIWAP